MSVFILAQQKISIRRAVAAGFIILAVFASLGRANAHSFNAVLIVPKDASQADERSMIDAFLVASEETDGHADQESDGHLGGLDVYLTPVRGMAWDKISAASPDFVVLNAANEDALAPSGVATVLVRPVAPSAQKAQTFLAAPADPGLASFAQRFETRAARAPTLSDQATYIAARQIDAAVRAQDGVGDPGALQAAVDQQ